MYSAASLVAGDDGGDSGDERGQQQQLAGRASSCEVGQVERASREHEADISSTQVFYHRAGRESICPNSLAPGVAVLPPYYTVFRSIVPLRSTKARAASSRGTRPPARATPQYPQLLSGDIPSTYFLRSTTPLHTPPVTSPPRPRPLRPTSTTRSSPLPSSLAPTCGVDRQQSSLRPSIPHAAIRVRPRGRPQTLASFPCASFVLLPFVWFLVPESLSRHSVHWPSIYSQTSHLSAAVPVIARCLRTISTVARPEVVTCRIQPHSALETSEQGQASVELTPSSLQTFRLSPFPHWPPWGGLPSSPPQSGGNAPQLATTLDASQHSACPMPCVGPSGAIASPRRSVQPAISSRRNWGRFGFGPSEMSAADRAQRRILLCSGSATLLE